MDNGATNQPEISPEDLENQITELAGHLNAANYRWLTLIAEFDRRNGWCDGTRVAAFRAAPTIVTSMRIMSNTGLTAAKPS
jgi:hypothetical protein